jgi:nitrite reductase/ring-hydroxylating ferredoxin subunit
MVVARFVRVGAVDEVKEGRGLAVEVDGLLVAVFRDAGRFFAVSGRCPHAGGSLGLGWIEEGEALCPLHRWRFKLATGRCTTVRGESVHPFRCEVRGDEVWVEV